MFLAMQVADLPVVAALGSCPEAGRWPCGVLGGISGGRDGRGGARGKLPLLAVNGVARGAGVEAGCALDRALVRCPDFQVLQRDAATEAELLGKLVRLGESLTPDLEVAAPDGVILDLSWRLGPADGLLEKVEWADGELAWAMAETPDLAALAARHEATRGRRVGPAEVAELPLAALEVLAGDAAAFRVLEWWGLRTLGDFMKLPRQALIERLGADAGRWQEVLEGRRCRLLRLHRAPESLMQRHEFEDGVVSVDPLRFVIRRMLHTLAGRLAARHLAVCGLELRMELEGGGVVARSLRLPDPQASEAGMLAPLQALLEALRLEGAVTALALDAVTTFGTTSQREWFGRQLPQPERWAETLAKLEAMLGPGRVGVPLPPESHRPDDFRLHPAGGAQAPQVDHRPDHALPLRRYRPPRVIAVAHETRSGRPFPLALLSGPHPGRIVDWRGPFPMSGGWWDAATAWQRIEWDVRMEDRRLLRLAHEVPDGWRVEGVYA